MTDDDLDFEARLRRYKAAEPPPELSGRIDERVARRSDRLRLAQWATVLLLAATAILHVATARVDRALAAGTPREAVDVDALAARIAVTEPLP